jgi:hypothetical protein
VEIGAVFIAGVKADHGARMISMIRTAAQDRMQVMIMMVDATMTALP